MDPRDGAYAITLSSKFFYVQSHLTSLPFVFGTQGHLYSCGSLEFALKIKISPEIVSDGPTSACQSSEIIATVSGLVIIFEYRLLYLNCNPNYIVVDL